MEHNEHNKKYTISEVADAVGLHPNTIRHRVDNGYYLGDYDYIDDNGVAKKFKLTKENDIFILNPNGKRKRIRVSQNFYDAALEKERTNKSEKGNAHQAVDKFENKTEFLNYFGKELFELVEEINSSDSKWNDADLVARVTSLLVMIDKYYQESLFELESQVDDLKYTYTLANTSKKSINNIQDDFSKIVSIEQQNQLIDKARECMEQWKKNDFSTLSKKNI